METLVLKFGVWFYSSSLWSKRFVVKDLQQPSWILRNDWMEHFQIQAAQMGFLQRVQCVRLPNKVCSFGLVFVPILTYGYESWLMTCRSRNIYMTKFYKLFDRHRVFMLLDACCFTSPQSPILFHVHKYAPSVRYHDAFSLKRVIGVII